MTGISKLKKPLITAGICVGAAIYLAVQNNWIQVTQEVVRLKGVKEGRSIKIVQISDTHLPKTASKIDKLARLVRNQNPDIIVMTGDLIDGKANIEMSGLAKLCQRMRAIAPVYAVTGNHEFKNKSVETWKEVLARNGVIVLDDDFAIWEKEGQELALIGLSNKMPYDMGIYEDIEEIADMPKVLLAHHPELFASYASEVDSIRPDMVFSGHAHGGQVRIPFVGGMYAPNQGLWPKYTSGQYESDNGTSMVVSRGIGNSGFPFRVNDRPNIPVVTLLPE